MDVRRRTEEIEHLTFAPWATFSDASRGRAVPEPQDPLRPVFQRDRDRVLHCKAFRRLKQKTQVFLSPEGDLYRTRLTHTLEVSQIARTIARGLRLNEDLTEAISLAHDLGHTPFGHAGEKALNALCPDGFHHYMQSLRVVDRLEKDGEGLNLTWEVRNGIVTHTTGAWARTPEGCVVRRKDYAASEEFDAALLETLRAHKIDLVVLAGFLSVLGPSVIAAYPRRILNVHPALIPSFCGPGMYGLRPHEAALARGCKVTGATVHFVNEECDGGPILLQKAVDILPGDTPEVLQKRVMEQAEWKLLPKAVAMICSGEIE